MYKSVNIKNYSELLLIAYDTIHGQRIEAAAIIPNELIKSNTSHLAAAYSNYENTGVGVAFNYNNGDPRIWTSNNGRKAILYGK